MGLVDSLAAEDRVEVKYSDFYKLVRAEAERALLKNAVHAGVPREQILKMMSGQNDELEEYHKTGLSPDQIREMDGFYADKCKEVAVLAAEKDVLQKQLDDLILQQEAEAVKAAAEGAVKAAAEGAVTEATQGNETDLEGQDPDKKNRESEEILIRVRSSL